jgi:hypothetical protein
MGSDCFYQQQNIWPDFWYVDEVRRLGHFHQELPSCRVLEQPHLIIQHEDLVHHQAVKHSSLLHQGFVQQAHLLYAGIELSGVVEQDCIEHSGLQHQDFIQYSRFKHQGFVLSLQYFERKAFVGLQRFIQQQLRIRLVLYPGVVFGLPRFFYRFLKQQLRCCCFQLVCRLEFGIHH